MVTSDVLLDLDGQGLRATGVRWQLLDRDLGDEGWFTPQADVATCQLDVGKPIMRTVDRVVLDRSTWSSINTASHLVRPWVDLADGSTWCVGTFAFADAPKVGRGPTGTMVGQLADMNQTISRAHLSVHGARVGVNIRDALLGLAALSEWLDGLWVDGVDARLTSPQAYGADRALLDSINAMAAPYGFYNLARDRFGAPFLRRLIDPEEAERTLDYDDHPRVLADGFSDAEGRLLASNAWKAIDSGNATFPAVGYYELPASDPMSPANRWVQGDIIDVQGISPGAAQEAAVWEAIRARRPQRTIEFGSPLDPRHDVLDTVRFDGLVWVETAWVMELRAGGKMTHTLTRPAATGVPA